MNMPEDIKQEMRENTRPFQEYLNVFRIYSTEYPFLPPFPFRYYYNYYNIYYFRNYSFLSLLNLNL